MRLEIQACRQLLFLSTSNHVITLFDQICELWSHDRINVNISTGIKLWLRSFDWLSIYFEALSCCNRLWLSSRSPIHKCPSLLSVHARSKRLLGPCLSQQGFNYSYEQYRLECWQPHTHWYDFFTDDEPLYRLLSSRHVPLVLCLFLHGVFILL